MFQEGSWCLVAYHGAQAKLHNLKIEGQGVRARSSPIGSAHVIVQRGFGKKMGV